MAVKASFASYPGLVPALAGAAAVLVILFMQGFSALAASPAEGETVFNGKCQACHSIGGGPLVGPDLKGITEREDRESVIDFIVNPQGSTMPDMGVSSAEAESVLLYIESRSGGSPIPVLISEDSPSVTGDTGIGRDIFLGETGLENGGSSCFSCHHIDGIAVLGGGTLGTDLTNAYSDYGEDGLLSVLGAMPFQIMSDIYAEKPLTAEEKAHLTAFLLDASNLYASKSNPVFFVIIGIAGCAGIIVLLRYIWGGRLTGVRQLLVKGDSK